MLAYSSVLNAEVVFVPGRASGMIVPVPSEWQDRVAYSITELRRIGKEKWTADELRRAHAAKDVFRGAEIM